MRFKRVLAMALCALLTLTVCMMLLPKTAHATVSNITIRGQTLAGATPYYKDGAISGLISDWQAYWDKTGNVLHLRNLSEIAVRQGIEVTGASGDSLTIDLQGSNSIEMGIGDAYKAIYAPTCALIFTGNGSLSVKSSGAHGGLPAYGIDANAIALTGNASLTVLGDGDVAPNQRATSGKVTLDWLQYNATAHESMNATAVPITQADYDLSWQTYQYVSFQHIPVPVPVPGGDGGATALGGDSGADVPRTGDGANPLLWLGLALLSGAGLGANIRRRKRG